MAPTRFVIPFVLMLLVAPALRAATECSVTCTYEEIVAPLGTAGEIGIRIQQRGVAVQTPSVSPYEVVGLGVQVLEQTPWMPVGDQAFEKRVVVSLAEVGDGSLVLRNGAFPETEDLRVLPIRVLTPLISGRWTHAMAGLYPLDWASGEEILSVLGVPFFLDGILSVDEVSCVWPTEPRRIIGCDSAARLFYVLRDGEVRPLLLVGGGFFYRCDHLLGTSGANGEG